MNHVQPSNDLPTSISSSVKSVDECHTANEIEMGLIRDIVEEDRGAMAQLYEIYYPRLHRFLTGMIGDQELIMELTNDVMMIVWQKAASYRGESLVSTWIFGIAHHRAVDGIRKNKRYRAMLDDAPRPALKDSSLSETTTTRDLNIIMQFLTPRQQAVAKLTFEFGYSYPEIAEILQIPVNTVKTRMFHARKSMQKSASQGDTSK